MPIGIACSRRRINVTAPRPKLAAAAPKLTGSGVGVCMPLGAKVPTAHHAQTFAGAVHHSWQ